jgi:acyl-CoA hydrolase
MTRTLSPNEAASLVRPRDTVGFGLGPAIPGTLLQALGERDDWEDLVLGGALLLGFYDVLERPGVRYRSGFFGPVERHYRSIGARVEHVPGGFRQFAPILARFAPRVMVVQTAPPDDAGNLNLSLHYGATRDELLRAGRDPDRLVIAEVNAQLPRTSCLDRFPNTLPLDVVDVVVETDTEPFALPEADATEVDRAIAAHALEYVSDGVTLQTGIGGVPSMVATLLAEADGGDYGVHSEMFTDGLMRLHAAGKVTNTAKGEFTGVSVTTFALGSADLYRWLDGNAQVAFLPVEVVNDPTVIGGNAKLISINGALSVDLFGQIVADSVGGRQISGVGGHEDFVAGPELHLDSRSLICLPSTATVDGQLVSRIVGGLPASSIVSTPRHHTGVVITEHGSADLVGLTVPERARALAEIAHPQFRDQLRAEAEQLGRD